MKKIYVLRFWYDNEDNSGGEVIAASENLHTLNSIMRDRVKRSSVTLFIAAPAITPKPCGKSPKSK